MRSVQVVCSVCVAMSWQELCPPVLITGHASKFLSSITIIPICAAKTEMFINYLIMPI